MFFYANKDATLRHCIAVEPYTRYVRDYDRTRLDHNAERFQRQNKLKLKMRGPDFCESLPPHAGCVGKNVP